MAWDISGGTIDVKINPRASILQVSSQNENGSHHKKKIIKEE